MAKCTESSIGKMRHRIILEEVSRTTDGQGGFTETWATVATVWAEIKPMSAYEKMQAMQLASPVNTKIAIRYRAGITAANRVNYNGRIMTIKEVINVDEGNNYLQLKCIEG